MSGLGAYLRNALYRAPALIGMVCLFAAAAAGGDDVRVLIPARGRPATPRADFRIESDLVLVPVSVTDSRNHTVIGLERNAFRLFENQTEQQIVQFAREDAPLSVGIVFDMSGSMTGKLQKSREAVTQFLHFANPADEFFLVSFRSRPRVAVPFTGDTSAIQNELLRAEPKGTTALLDAVCLAMDYMRHARYSRRALLILSDGGDNNSRYSRAEIRDRVREADLWIYAVGLYDPARSDAPREIAGGRKLMEALAEESGGREFAVPLPIDLPMVAARISVELRNQYVLGYRPSNPLRDGKYRQVHVSVVDGRRLNVASRPGYYAAGE